MAETMDYIGAPIESHHAIAPRVDTVLNDIVLLVIDKERIGSFKDIAGAIHP